MIDWSRINDLRGEIGEDGFDEVAALFLEEADDALAMLTNAGEAKALEAALHSLKGSALNLGFRVLAALCQVGEKRAASGYCDVDLDPIKTCYHASRDVFLCGQDHTAVPALSA